MIHRDWDAFKIRVRNDTINFHFTNGCATISNETVLEEIMHVLKRLGFVRMLTAEELANNWGDEEFLNPPETTVDSEAIGPFFEIQTFVCIWQLEQCPEKELFDHNMFPAVIATDENDVGYVRTEPLTVQEKEELNDAYYVDITPEINRKRREIKKSCGPT